MKKVDFKMPSMTDHVAALFQPRKKASPMFNRPMGNVCPHHRVSRVLHTVFLSLLVVISILVIALKAMTYNFIESNREKGFMFETTELDGDEGVSITMAALPRMLFHTPAKLALIAAVISTFLGIAHLTCVAVDWRSGKRVHIGLIIQAWSFRRNIMLLHLMNGIVVVFALISVFITHKSSSQFRDGYVNFSVTFMNGQKPNPKIAPTPKFFRYSLGTFDLETWSCELKDVRGTGMARDEYSKQCGIEVAGRAAMIAFMVLAWLVAAIGIWSLFKGGRRGPDGERIKTEDVGLEMGKMNAI